MEWNTEVAQVTQWSWRISYKPELFTDADRALGFIEAPELALDVMFHSPGIEWIETDYKWRIGWEGCGLCRYAYQDPRPPPRGKLLTVGSRLFPLAVHDAMATKLAIPYWLVAILTAVWPAMRIRSILRRWRRVRLNLCIDCGYDLRASSGKCPECGAAAVTSAVK